MPFNGWIEVFRTGKHTDSKGRIREWTTGDLDEIVKKYDAKYHEAPLVVGHPKDNSPAFGWVEGVKREGSKLFVKLKQVMPEFAQAVKEGRYKKRSVSIHPEYGLRHIGFLGGQAPALKGLADISFSDNDNSIVMEFEETQKFSDIKDEGYSMPKTVEELEKELKQKEQQIAKFSEQVKEKEQKITELVKQVAEQKQSSANFSERQNEQLKAASARIEQLEKQMKQKSCEDFCEELAKDGRLHPAQRESVIDFMMKLDDLTEHEFAEGKKKTQLDQYREQLKAAPKLVEFGEQAVKGKVSKASAGARELAQKAHEYKEAEAKAGRAISIADAVAAVSESQE